MSQETLYKIIDTTAESPAEDLRENIISNLSVPSSKISKVSNVKNSPFTEYQPGGDVISEPIQSGNLSIGRPVRKRTQANRMNISSNKGNTYDVAM